MNIARQRIWSLTLLFLLIAWPLAARAQDDAATATSTDALETQPLSPADEAFAPIHKRFVNLYNSLSARQGMWESDRSVVLTLHELVKAFRVTWPDHGPSAAVDYQLSVWLDDEARADEAYEALLRLYPDRSSLWLRSVRERIAENKYDEAIAAIDALGADYATDVDVTVTLAQCYMANNRFQDAVDALNLIDEAALSDKNRLQGITNLKTEALQWQVDWLREQDIRAAEREDDDLPLVEINTAKGRILLELFENQEPNTVTNLIYLTEREFYDGITFHRVEPNLVIQAGDPITKTDLQGTPGTNGPGYTIPDEHGDDNDRMFFAGVLGMARTGAPNSSGSQFFITVKPSAPWNGQYTAFGRVVEGLDVVRAIRKDDVIESMRVLRKRDHGYIPCTINAPMHRDDLEDFTPTEEPTVAEPDVSDADDDPFGGTGSGLRLDAPASSETEDDPLGGTTSGD
jgi:peptidyl-prolyl cis-trans isomerase B (cyclophilin B)